MLVLRAIVAVLRLVFTTKADLAIENLALHQQLNVLHRRVKRPKLRRRDRVFWLWLARCWDGWKNTLIVVKPETVIRWHRKGFKYYWAEEPQDGRPARCTP